MIDWLLAPLHYDFMLAGLLASALVGVACAAIGVYVVLRRMAFIGDALAHTTLPGMVVPISTAGISMAGQSWQA